MTNEQKRKAEADFAARAGRVTDADVGDMLRKQDQVDQKMHAGVLCKYIGDVKTFFQLLADYWRGSYREVPFRTIAAIVGALAYLLCPIDAIPDFIPVLGLVDDAAVIALCLKLVHGDLDDYREWRRLGHAA